jgi:hypothetical protein
LKMSVANQPLLHQVILTIDYLRKTCEKVATDDNKHMAVRHAAKHGAKVLDKYYSLSDNSEMYRVAIGKLID